MQKVYFSLQSPLAHIRRFYDEFDAPVTSIDCGQKCAPHNPGGKPFCCDICHAVPAAYNEEWSFLQQHTHLWQAWRGDECAGITQDNRENLLADVPANMILLACQGPQYCERPYRASSCRQFPFFPYITSDYRFIGLAYDWEFEQTCWVISHLKEVTATYQQQFINIHDQLIAFSQDIFDSYHEHSRRMREYFGSIHRRIPILHRNGNCYLISPGSERMTKTPVQSLPRFGVYREY